MTTRVYDVAGTISLRVAELEELLGLADSIRRAVTTRQSASASRLAWKRAVSSAQQKAIKEQDDAQYAAVCRACSVLLVSHLEGFVKELCKAIADDLTTNLGSFSSMPETMKRAFCEKIASYDNVPKEEIEQRIKQLSAYFTTNSVKIDFGAFSYKENKNRNMGADVIDAALAKVGIPMAVYSASGTVFDGIFSGDDFLAFMLMRDLKRYRSVLRRFPFSLLPSRYTFTYRASKQGGKNAETIWHAYLEQVMARRHAIAHGDTMTNDVTLEELSQDVRKMSVFMHALMFASANYVATKLCAP
jgi:hypothetical protein